MPPGGCQPIDGRPRGFLVDVGTDVNVSDEGRSGRRRAAALVDRRLKAGQLERVRRRWGGAALPGGAYGGVYRARP